MRKAKIEAEMIVFENMAGMLMRRSMNVKLMREAVAI
jgi:hypothetical protein